MLHCCIDTSSFSYLTWLLLWLLLIDPLCTILSRAENLFSTLFLSESISVAIAVSIYKQTKSNKYNFKIMIICNDLSGMLFDLLLVWTWEQLLALMSYYHDQFSNNNYCKMYCFLINNHKIETHWEKRRFCFPKGQNFSWFSVFDYILKNKNILW